MISEWITKRLYVSYFKKELEILITNKEFNTKHKKTQQYDIFFENIHDDIHNIYYAMNNEKIKIKRKELKCRIERNYGIDITSNIAIFITICMTMLNFFFSSMRDIKSSIKPEQTKFINQIDQNIESFYSRTIGIILIYIAIVTITKIFDGYKKSFLMLCLDIIDDVIKENLQKEQLELAKQEAAATKYKNDSKNILMRIVNKIISKISE